MTTSKWAKKRQMYYGMGFVIFLLALISPIMFSLIYNKPTCFDGKQNQGEVAVDKGGPCKLLDEKALKPLNILWSRAFKVRDSDYSAVAYIENSNKDSGIKSIAYQFKFYNSKNFLVAERFGEVPILPGKIIPILETNIKTGNQEIARTFFQFLDSEVWVRMKDPSEGLSVTKESVIDKESSTELSTVLVNSSLEEKRNIVLIATIFDDLGNAFASTHTFVESIKPNEEKAISFIWPSKSNSTPARVDVAVLIAP